MNTTFQTVYDFFLSKIDTYEYNDLTDEEMKLEMDMLIKKALAKCFTMNNIKPDFILEEFDRELELFEVDAISDYMVLGFIEPKINTLKLLKQRMSSKDFNMTSQANHLQSLLILKNNLSSSVSNNINTFNWRKKARGE